LTYTVAAGIGLAFSLTLVYLAWRNALDGEAEKFAYASIALKETVARGVTAGDDVTNNIATLFEGTERVSEDTFRSFASSVLSRYPFIDGVSFHPLTPKPSDPVRAVQGQPASGSGEEEAISQVLANLEQFEFPAKLKHWREPQDNFPPHADLSREPNILDVLRSAMETGGVVPTPPLQTSSEGNGYFLLKAVYSREASEQDAPKRLKGIVATAINPLRLFGQSSLHENLFIQLFSVSEGVTGRQRQFEKGMPPATEMRGGQITGFNKEDLTQFPHYSMKLVIGKSVFWGEIEKGLILTAILIGGGMSLLLVALARAKELQALELLERNIEIERQVRRQTTELATARDQALEASRVKSEFLASMSHEIRTPLNAIIGMAELLDETPLTPDQKKYVEIYKKAGEALQSLVNDILDFSKIEANQLQLESIDFDLQALVEGTVGLHALKCDEKGIKLRCAIAADVPAFVRGDPSRIRQVILNLVGNAVKFTGKGGIVVWVRRRNPNSQELLFSVSDTGIGIPTDKLEAVFGSFTQVDSSTTRKFGGTGLGLAISRRLVELMGGRIWVQSELGIGSAFSFLLKLEPAPKPMRKEAVFVPAPAAGRERVKTHETTEALVDCDARILLVEDTADNRLLVKAFLKGRPYQVDEAENGEIALEKFKSQSYRLVLMDVQMPVMDGYESTRRMRAWEKEQGREPTPIVALTAHAIKEDVEKSLAAGCNAHLNKPIRKATLLEAIERHIGHGGG
jgi:signal transduction histidine kinase/CheY-like chemotaxis protein